MTGYIKVDNARTPIDTIFYTDKDRHKIYPKKCWIVGSTQSGATRDSSRDFSISNINMSGSLIVDNLLYPLDVSGRGYNPYNVAVATPTEVSGRAINGNPSNGSGATIGSVGLLQEGSNVNIQVFTSTSNSRARSQNIGISNITGSFAVGNTYWVISGSNARAFTFNPSTRILTRNSARDFSVASGSVGGTSFGNTVYILSTGGIVQAFDASGTGVPARKPELDFEGNEGATIVGQSSSTSSLNGLWIGASSGSMSFYSVRAKYVNRDLWASRYSLPRITPLHTSWHQIRLLKTASGGVGNPTNYPAGANIQHILMFALQSVGVTESQFDELMANNNNIVYQVQATSISLNIRYFAWTASYGNQASTRNVRLFSNRILRFAFADLASSDTPSQRRWIVYRLNDNKINLTILQYPVWRVPDADKETAYVLDDSNPNFGGTQEVKAGSSEKTLLPWYTKDTSIPVISAFQSAPSEIDEDASPPTNITLTWQTTGTVTRERITDLHRNANVPLSGNKRAVVARPLANTVYSLVATNGSFGSTTAKITVPVFKDCVINSFTVQYITNPLSPHGATVYFNINVTGKPRPTVSIDNGVGGANTHLTYDDDTGVLSGRIVHTFAGPRTFTATLTANNTQANGVAGPQATRTVQVIIP